MAISLLAGLAVTSDVLGIEFALNLHFTEALALAGILSLSSLGLVAKVLADGGNLKEPIGLEIFTTLMIAELLALMIVGFSIQDSGQAFSVTHVFILLGQIAGFTVVSWVLSARVLPIVIVHLQRLLHAPELSFGLVIGGLFLMVVVAEEIGLHGSIGALLFGAALSGMPGTFARRDARCPQHSRGVIRSPLFRRGGRAFGPVLPEPARVDHRGAGGSAVIGQIRRSVYRRFRRSSGPPFAQATGLMAKGWPRSHCFSCS